jgi:hypothetical protein
MALIANGTILSSKNKKPRLRNRVPLPIAELSPVCSDDDISSMLRIAVIYKLNNVGPPLHLFTRY